MDDLIRRGDAIRLAEQGQIQGFEWQFKKLCELPSAEPKTKLIAEVKISKEDIQNAVDEAVVKIKAKSERKGKWIKTPEFCGDDISGFIDNHFSCSECKKEAEINPWGFYILSDFCPNCGADMRGDLS